MSFSQLLTPISSLLTPNSYLLTPISSLLRSHSKLNAEKSLTLFSALFFYLFQGLKWEKRGDEW